MVKLGDILDYAITHEYRHPRDPAGAYPTSASIEVDGEIKGACARAQWYGKRTEREAVSAETAAIFKRGNIIETNFVMELLRQAGCLIDDNIRFNGWGQGYAEKVYISGEIDGLIKTEDPDVFHMVECKTYTASYFNLKSLRENGAFHNPKYLLQCMVYLDQFPARSPLIVDGITLLYIDANRPGPENRFEFSLNLDEDGNLVVQGLTFDSWNIKNVYDRMAKAVKYLEGDELPPRDYAPAYSEEQIQLYLDDKKISKTQHTKYTKGEIEYIGDFDCTYCPFRVMCIEDSVLTEVSEGEEVDY